MRERIALSERLAPGEALPVIDHRMQALDGRPFVVEATAVAVDSVAGRRC